MPCGGDGNATTLADQIECFDIRDYLVSKGGVDLRDVTPPNYPRSHEMIDEHFAQTYHGGGEVVLAIDQLEPPVAIMLIDGVQSQIAYTKGLSDRVLPDGPRKHACSELMISLPPGTGRDSTVYDWTMSELSRLVQMLDNQLAWFSQHIVTAEPSGTECPFVGWLVLRLDLRITPPDYRVIRTHELIPLFQEECDLLSHLGIDRNARRQIEDLQPTFLPMDRKRVIAETKE